MWLLVDKNGIWLQICPLVSVVLFSDFQSFSYSHESDMDGNPDLDPVRPKPTSCSILCRILYLEGSCGGITLSQYKWLSDHKKEPWFCLDMHAPFGRGFYP